MRVRVIAMVTVKGRMGVSMSVSMRVRVTPPPYTTRNRGINREVRSAGPRFIKQALGFADVQKL